MVDIFQAVQIIQLQRPGSIKTMTQYAFTYDCVYEYIRTYSSSP
jgi:protein tyrosine phosphatase